MEISLVGDRIVVTDGSHTYSVNADDNAPLWTGAESEYTYREALAAGKLDVADENTGSMYGSLYVTPGYSAE